MVFRRRRPTDDSGVPDEVDEVDSFDDRAGTADDALEPGAGERAVTGDVAPGPPPEPYAVAAGARPAGPWDIHDLPADDEVPRIDLGGIHVPVPEGLEVRVEVQDDVPVAATLVDGPSQLQVHAFAAPKSSGLWAQVRAEIAESLRGAGGSAEEVEGPFGPELRARIPVDGGRLEPARFIGVDGPRWFIRGLMTGAATADSLHAERLEAGFRQIVVNRGGDAMAPRDMLPLHLPREAFEATPPEADHSLSLPERGPEITETR